jgi:hypothetical protein
MKRLSVIMAAGAFALAGCGEVSVTSNDARTQEMINGVQEGAADLVNSAGNIAADAGNELGEAADALGNSVEGLGEANVSVSRNKAN